MYRAHIADVYVSFATQFRQDSISYICEHIIFCEQQRWILSLLASLSEIAYQQHDDVNNCLKIHTELFEKTVVRTDFFL